MSAWLRRKRCLIFYVGFQWVPELKQTKTIKRMNWVMYRSSVDFIEDASLSHHPAAHHSGSELP